MKVKKVEIYDSGYSRTELLKKGSAAVAAALLMCGGLASCGMEYAGDIQYIPDDYDDEISSDDVSSACESNEVLTLDGDVVYVPESSES